MSSSNDGDFSGITTPSDEVVDQGVYQPPAGVYPWIRFWDLMNLNKHRRLHSCLLFKGPVDCTQFMPLHVYDEQMDQVIKKPRYNKALNMAKKRFTTRQPKTELNLSTNDYERIWEQGKYT